MSTTVVAHRFLFNFAASYSSGGYKRLYEYAKWFDAQGGAWFVIHPNCAHLERDFARNRYFTVTQSRLQRLYDDCAYLAPIEAQIGRPQLYYAYGIPLYRRVGVVNWFHLSNVLAMGGRGVPQPLGDRLRYWWLGSSIRRGFKFADVISAESQTSVDKIGLADRARLFVSVNGSDDELDSLRMTRHPPAEDVVSVVGTIGYKALPDAHRVFQMLRHSNERLQLVIMGNPDWVPADLKRQPHVIVAGTLERAEVMRRLRASKFYISTTYVENSYNAASEGIFSAEQAYVSDIGPHRELLNGSPVERVSIPGVSRPLLHVRRAQLRGEHLKTWNTVVIEMIARFRAAYSNVQPVSAEIS